MSEITYKVNRQIVLNELIKYNSLPISIALLYLYLNDSLSSFQDYSIYDLNLKEVISKSHLSLMRGSSNDYKLLEEYFSSNTSVKPLSCYIIKQNIEAPPIAKDLLLTSKNITLINAIKSLFHYFCTSERNNNKIPIEVGLAYIYFNKNFWLSMCDYSNNSTFFYIMIDKGQIIQTNSRFSGPYSPLELSFILKNIKSFYFSIP